MGFLASPLSLALGGLLGKSLVKKGLKAVGIGKKKAPIEAARTRAPGMIEAMGGADREALEQRDALRRRRGSGADLITGVRGAEAAAGSVGRLVAGS